MPLGEGYWIHEDTLDVRECYEHLLDVMQHPDVFGVKPAGDRRATLRDVLRNGWIRCRYHRGHYTFETWRDTDRSREAVAFLLAKSGAWDTECVTINDVQSSRCAMVRTSEIRG